MKISKKLTLSFLFLIIVSIIIISSISNFMINKRFDLYLIKERENKFSRIQEEINLLLIENENILDEMDLKHLALAEDIDIQINDKNGNIVYSSNTNNTPLNRRGMRGHMGHMHDDPQGNYGGDYEEKTYDLYENGTIIGSLTIGYIDNSYFTESAILFKRTLLNSFLLSGFITIIIGFIVSIFVSQGLTNPLINIQHTANEIRQGNLSAKSQVNTNTREIKDLSQSINYLGASLLNHEEIRKRYASDISHELRTPITTLKTHLEAIIDGVWEPNKEHLDILMDETLRLSKLVEDLKDSFNLEEYKITLYKTKFNLSQELKDIITKYTPIYNKDNFQIQGSIEEDIYIEMDRDKLNQIINNLLSNAKRYLNHDGRVIIELKDFKDHVIIKVKDNGLGIKKEDLDFIFQRFYRVDTSRNKSTGGTGLGLAIVKSIVTAHGGTIDIESEYEKGTEITINLPK